MTIAPRMFLTGMAGALILGTPAPALAQDQSVGLEEIVVTARKRSENAQTIPISLTALGEQALTRSGIERFEDVVQFVPNMSITGGLGTALQGEIGIRGISTLVRVIGVETGLGFYVDGIYTGRPETFSTELVDVERVEVLRGPQGTLFGRNTIAGAINIITKTPGDEVTGKLEAEYGNYNLFRLKGVISGPLIEERLYGEIAATYASRDGTYKHISGGRDLDDIDSTTFRAKLRATPSDSLEIILAGDGMFDRNHPNFTQVLELALPVPVTTTPFTTNRNRENKLNKDIWGLSATINYDAGFGTVTAISSYRKSKFTAFLDEDGNQIDLFNSEWTDRVDIFTQEVRLAGRLGERLDYVAGIYYLNQKADTFRPFMTGADFPIPVLANFPITQVGSVDTESIAGFAHLTYQLADRLSLAAGLRYTHEKKDAVYNQTGAPIVPDIATTEGFSDNALSPSATLSYNVTDDVLTYASFSRGFKSGGFNTDFVPDASSIMVKPEFASSYEVGLKSDLFDRRLRLNFAAFYTDYTNLQVSQIDPAIVGVRLTNAGQAKIKGLEVEMTARPAAGLDLNASLGYIDATYKTYPNCAANPATGGLLDCSGNRIKSVPKWTAALAAQYRYPIQNLGDFVVRGEWTYHSSQFFDTLNTARLRGGSASLLNGRIGLSTERWELFIWGKNLTNNLYAAFMDDRSAILVPLTVAYGAPRTYGVTATAHF